MSDIARIAAFVMLTGGVLSVFAGLVVVTATIALESEAVANPVAALQSVALLGAGGAIVGLVYGIVAGIVAALVRRMPIPGRALAAAAIVFVVAMSGFGDRLGSLVVADTTLPRLDGAITLLARALFAAIVAYVAWQEAGAPVRSGTVATVGQAGRAQRR